MKEKYCTVCGAIGSPKLRTKGNTWVELLLWFFLCLPGLIYTAWRHTSRAQACPNCGSEAIIPVNSPIARQNIGEAQPLAATIVPETNWRAFFRKICFAVFKFSVGLVYVVLFGMTVAGAVMTFSVHFDAPNLFVFVFFAVLFLGATFPVIKLFRKRTS